MKKRDTSFETLMEYNVDLKNRVIYLVDDITTELAEDIKKIIIFFEMQSTKPISISINSPGGEVYASLSIVDIIENSRCKIITSATGLCASGATLIYVAGDYRVATRYTTFMLHELSSIELGKHTDVKNNVKHNEHLMQQFSQIYLQHTNLTKQELDRHLIKDWYLTAEQAKERGIVDLIIMPRKDKCKK